MPSTSLVVTCWTTSNQWTDDDGDDAAANAARARASERQIASVS
jgi:hypothetical protein